VKVIERLIPQAFRLFLLALLCLGPLVFPAFSQNCALCYTQAASSGARMIEALKSGILILVIPPTLGSVAMIFVLRRKRNQIRRIDERGTPGADWQQDWYNGDH
jgi:TRAP-type C4-dicarboxylate transport system permease small subunit